MIFSKKYNALIFTSLTLLLSGCLTDTQVKGLTTAVTGTSTVLTDVKRLVSYGQSRTFNNRTAGVNDLELNPLTKDPAVAYYDQDQRGTSNPNVRGALKYAYMDSSGNWTIEVVDVNYASTAVAGACGTINTYCIGAPNAAGAGLAQVINLAFKSDGTPVIAYIFGASLNTTGDREVRYAERDSSGSWTVTRAFTINNGGGVAEPTQTATVNSMTGLTLLLDSSNRPHITFALYTTTATNSRIKYLFRDSTGTWSSSDMMNAITGAGTVTAVTGGSIQAGAAWCSLGTASSTPTTPMGVYSYQVVTGAAGVTAHPVYLNCTAVNGNGSCGTWNALNLVNGCAGATACVSSFSGTTAAGTRIDMTVEPTGGKPLLAIYSATAPATQLGAVLAPTACNVTQTATTNSWGAMTSIEAAAANNNGHKIMAASNLDFILAYNLTTTATRVMRTTTGQGGWGAVAGHTIETSTVGAEGVGAAYDTTYGKVHVSWGSGSNGAAGAVTNDLKVGTIQVANIVNGTAAGLFDIEAIDSTGTAFPNPTAGSLPLMSAAKATDGTVGYTYFYNDATGADMKLFYGIRYNAPSRPLFMETQVINYQEGTTSTLAVGLNPSLAYDANSNPVIAYYNGVATEQNLNIARSNNGGQNFTTTSIDKTSANVGQYANVKTFGSSIGVVYKDVTNTAVKFARWTPGDRWRKFTIDGGAGVTGTGCAVGNASGDFAKMTFTSSGNPVIVYQDDTAVPALVRLAVASESVTSSTFTWTCLTIDSSGVSGVGRGEGLDVTLDQYDRPYIVNFDAAAGSIRYSYSALGVLTAAAAGSGAFTDVSVATVGVPLILSAYVVPSIQVNTSGTVFIAYHDKNNYRYALATKLSSSSSFTFEAIDTAPLGGSTSSLAGSYGSMLLNDSGNPMLIYGSYASWIKYFSREYL